MKALSLSRGSLQVMLLLLLLMFAALFMSLLVSKNSFSNLPALKLYQVATKEQPSTKKEAIREKRYPDGVVSVHLDDGIMPEEQRAKLTGAQLELLYDKYTRTLTASCSTGRRFGEKGDGGYDLCLVGPFRPHSPCFSLSFGINYVWGYDDEVANEFKCQVVGFDPSMSNKSHWRSDKILFLQEGLHGKKFMLNNKWPVDTYSAYLQRLGAQNLIIDILKVDIESSEWPALEVAVKDGSLKNVKQLLVELHSTQVSKEGFMRFLNLFSNINKLGFRLWHSTWNIVCKYKSLSGQEMTMCLELCFINMHFIDQPRQNDKDAKLIDIIPRENSKKNS